MSKPMRLLFALLATLALVAAACGSDSDGDTATDEGDTATDEGDTATDEGDDSEADEGDDSEADEGDDSEADEGDDSDMNATPGAGVSVTMARANWSTGYMQAAIYHNLMEELGYEVSEPADLELPPSNFFTALGQGDVDFWVNSWYPGHKSWWDNELTDGSTVGDKISILGEQMMTSGLQGYLTNIELVDEYGIETIDQINSDQELIDLYDAGDTTPGDGKVQILGCPEDWTCDDIINTNIEFAGWDNIEQTKAGYDAMIAEAVARAEDGTPFIIYTWSPSAYLTKLIPGTNAKWLAIEEDSVINEGEHNQTFEGSAVPAAIGLDQCSADPCNLGWLAADIQVSANNEFLDANPAAKALFEIVQIPVIDVALQSVKYDGGENTTEDVHAHAAEWIEDNRATVDEWLAEARGA